MAHGAVLRRYDRRADKLTTNQAELIGKFQAGLRAEGCAVSTVRTYGTLAREFLSFVDTRGRLAECDTKTAFITMFKKAPGHLSAHCLSSLFR